MTGFEETAVAQSYGVNCFINTAFPGPANDDGSFDFVRFVYTIDSSGGGQQQPNPKARGNGDRTSVRISKGVNGQTFSFTVCDYGNLPTVVTLTNITVDLKANTIVWLFSDPYPLTGTGTQNPVRAGQSAVSPDGPSMMWSGVLKTTFANMSVRLGAVMEFTVSVTVNILNQDGSTTTMTFRADPQMQVDPN